MSEPIDYRTTLNLPKTGFPMKANLPQREPNCLKQWESMALYEAIREKRRGQKQYILHDGPPYANGDVHLGTALNKILKDMVVKFKTLQGYDVPYVPGWDCHGMPIEHQLLKEMGITKADITPVILRKKARKFALKYVDKQRKQFQRLGVLSEWDNPYLTLSNDYEANIIKAFGVLVRRKHVYRGMKPINWCPQCETALAEAEVEYDEHTSPSVFVRFNLNAVPEAIRVHSNDVTVSFVIWTTTPWTLTANVAIALHPELDYALTGIYTAGVLQEILILAHDRVSAVLGSVDMVESDKNGYRVLKTVKGSALTEGAWGDVTACNPLVERLSRIVTADYVSQEEGSGCVHIAPGHGEDDYMVGKANGLEVIMEVNAQGAFNPGNEPWSGKHVFEANPVIVEMLKKKGLLLKAQSIVHAYPHCWRCKGALVFRSARQWFVGIDTNDLRARAASEINKVRWVPAVGRRRIGAMVELRPDWCLSRQRYWGVPIPVFYCTACATEIADPDLIDRIAERVRKESADIWYTATIADLVGNLTCRSCGGSEFVKETDILDVWFDSGVSHYAVVKERAYLRYPADLYLEGSDQHRGWFQTSLLTSVGINGQAPFETVVTHGFVVDGEGKKMSKSRDNVVKPDQILKDYGADILRIWVASSDYQGDVRVSDEIMSRTSEAYRKIRNTFKYILGNLADFDPMNDAIDYAAMTSIDQWVLAELAALITTVTAAYDDFEFHTAFKELHRFCTVTLSSFYLDVLKDRLYTFHSASGPRRATQTALWEIVKALTIMLSPVISFTAEEVWLSLPEMARGGLSVHLADWPQAMPQWQQAAMRADWARLIAFRDQVMKELEHKRTEGIIGTSLEAALIVTVNDPALYTLLNAHQEDLALMCIVSSFTLKQGKAEAVDPVHIKVVPAEGTKCIRCWHYSTSCGLNPQHPEICQKCWPAL